MFSPCSNFTSESAVLVNYNLLSFKGKTEVIPGALGGGEEEAYGRKEEAAQRGQA